jgi:hypothetical protein
MRDSRKGVAITRRTRTESELPWFQWGA